MSTPTHQVVRPAGAGHETLYVLALCLIILLVAGTVIGWHGERQDVQSVAAHELDARRDLTASEQGIYADLRVTLDEIRLLAPEQATPVTPQLLSEEGLAPFVEDASSVSRGGHAWRMIDKSYLGVSQNPTVAGSFLLRIGATDDAQADIWINRSPSLSQDITDVSDKALIASGWKQVVAQFDAGVTRQHKH
ncbi:DUF6162 family protein [Pseudomonas quasicaspiana]|uniref:DUF6162 family protein n=1 Tax=Pseudomonas quasicaspiana TaxID=2829821 RepID=UPI000F055AFB|nr:DUF6162 family protein [Pseudomonas quasicaspiana]MCD5973772.1 hypothetical protein [Pseudomonas quasicaspiana]